MAYLDFCTIMSFFWFSIFFQIDVQTGVKDCAKGSSYVEMGTTKVLCVVKGPKDLPKKLDFR